MPTIKDIAKEAGVSHGTVSNVINGRGNVSVEKIQLVWQAAEKLGYKVNSKAQSLRQGKDRTIAIILPGIEDPFYATMYEVFQREFAQYQFSVRLYSTKSADLSEASLLNDALNSRVCAIISSSSFPDAASRYRTEAPDLPLVFLQWNGTVFSDVMYAGFDYRKAGKDTAEFAKKHSSGKIGVFTNTATNPDTALFLQGFQSGFPQKSSEICFVHCPDHQIELRAFDFFEESDNIDFIVCADQRRFNAVCAAHAYCSMQPMPQALMIAPRVAVPNAESTIYELDCKRLAHRIVKTLVSRLDHDHVLPSVLHMDNSGFRAYRSNTIYHDQDLRLLTIASPATAALNRLLPHLEKNTGLRMSITTLPSLSDVYAVLQTSEREQYDIIRMDVAWMDELAKKIFLPLSKISYDWDSLFNQVIPELGNNYSYVDNERYCIPYDPSTQLLFYRKDLFTNPTIKRMYYEREKTELLIPESFSAYNRIASFFTSSLNPSSPVQYGSTVAIGNVSVSPSEYLIRLFEQNGSILDANGKISVNTPEAVSALRSYKETYSYSDRTVYNFWKSALEGFAEGSAAMTVVFINYASHILNSQMSSISGNLGFAPVPGGKPLLGGGVLGITNTCQHPDATCEFFSWLYSDQIAPVFTMLGGLSPCRSAYGNRDVNENYPWLSTARKCFASAHRRGASDQYANFSELQLENILAARIQSAVLGITTIEDSLAQAQLDCDNYFVTK